MNGFYYWCIAPSQLTTMCESFTVMDRYQREFEHDTNICTRMFRGSQSPHWGFCPAEYIAFYNTKEEAEEVRKMLADMGFASYLFRLRVGF